VKGNLRAKVIIGVVAIVAIAFISRLFYLQVINQEFKEAALQTKARERSVHAYRGIIFDRNGVPLVTNVTIYDLMVTTGDIHDLDTTRICQLLDITQAEFDAYMKAVYDAGDKHSSYKPYSLIKQISLEEFAAIQDRFDFSGFTFSPRLIRNYPEGTLASTLGYIAEIDPDELDEDKSGYYRLGDYVGKSGLEKEYELFLRGIRGKELFMVNRKEIEMGPYDGGIYDSIAIPGRNLMTSIDAGLQAYGEQLMNGKSGSIVCIEPSSGEILSIVTAPSYDPNMLTGRKFSDSFYKLKEDTARDPLYNRATMGTYPPGSIFKLVQAAIALEEGIVKDGSTYRIGPYPNMGDHSPAGSYTIQKAIMKSSNWFFAWKYKEMIHLKKKKNRYEDAEYGFDNWRDHLLKFGLGKILNTDLGYEKSGNVPTNAYYDKIYGDRRWKASTIISNAIGQGDLLVVPIQMANFAACIANRG
jgi:penicillin-binding protein 2